MNHKTMQWLVSSSLDGEVSKAEKAEVRSHLGVCPECRHFLEHAKRVREELRALGGVELPNSFAARVAYSVERRDEQTVEWLGIEPSARNTFILLAGLVIAVFILTSYDNPAVMGISEQLFYKNNSDSAATRVLLQQEKLTKNDLLYAVMTK